MEVSPGNADTIDAYSRLSAAHYASLGAEGDFGRRALLNPTIFRMLGDVSGRSILDAGCGHGYLSRLLADRGARVVGIEPAEVPLRYAVGVEKERRQGIAFVQRDLSVPGELGGSFDAVVANMVLLDIADWRPAMGNCVAALKPGGLFVYSLHHPIWTPGQPDIWIRRGVVEVRDYLNEHEQTIGHAPSFHRTLSTYVNETIRLGCSIVEMAEPRLRPEQSPSHEILTRIPNYVVIAARCPSALEREADAHGSDRSATGDGPAT
ncbi:MAG: class I SAM-dependent methyltransferase [Ilumatobacteraceae bacterium]